LVAHNRYRAKHGAQPLKHNKKLSEIAQGWADNLAKSGQFKHSTNKYQGNNLGENIASKMSSAGADYDGKFTSVSGSHLGNWWPSWKLVAILETGGHLGNWWPSWKLVAILETDDLVEYAQLRYKQMQ
jgi:hypothetical protein